MKNKILILSGCIVLFIAGGLYLAAKPAPDEIQGMIDTDEIQIAARVSGRLESLLVKEGDTVQKGQALFLLSNKELEAQLGAAKAALSGAEAQQEKANNGLQAEDITAAKAAWLAQKTVSEEALTTAARFNNLYAEGVVSAQKRDEVSARAKASAAAEVAARAQYEKSLKGVRDEDKKFIGAQVTQASEAQKAVASFEDELRTPAPADGEITKRFANEGEVVPPGFPIFSMIRLNDFWVSFNVKESQFSGLSMGQELIGKVPALNNKELKFKVYFISPQGDFATWRATRNSSGYDIKSFEIRAKPIDQAPELRPGMSVLFNWPPIVDLK